MKKTFIAGAAAVFFLAACTEELRPVCQESPEKVELSVTVPVTSMTKVTDTGNENAVSRVQVFVFREDGSIDAWSIAESDSLIIDCTAGDREVVAVVNAPRIVNIFNIDALREEVSDLQDNSVGSLVMSGSKKVTLSASASITVPVRRLVARVSIERIVTDFALEQYRNSEFIIKGIYLTNVAGDVHYIGDEAPSYWHNSQGKDLLEQELIETGEMSEPVAPGIPYDTPHYFYCCPNPYLADSYAEEWCPRHTRLVVEASLSGRICYYTMTMPVIESNHLYTVTELRITRPGSSDPEQEMLPGDASFAIEVEDWEEGYTGQFEI